MSGEPLEGREKVNGQARGRCAVWADGEHCYRILGEGAAQAKWCMCGALVRLELDHWPPRDGEG